MAVRKIKIYVEQKSTADGRKFNAYHTATKNGVKMTVKFRKEVAPTPSENCYINVNDDNMNEQKNSIFPVLWISKIDSVEPLEGVNREENSRRMAELFGD